MEKKHTGPLAARRGDVPYLYGMRVLATLAVVMTHVVSKEFVVPLTSSSEWQLLNFYDSLCRWAVPVFVMISGALFLDPEREVPLGKLFGKYMLRIFTALVFWSGVYAVAYAGIYLRGGFSEILTYFLEGHVHLWYLYMMLGLYLTVPVLRQVARSPVASRYYVLLSAVFSVVLPALFRLKGTAVPQSIVGRLQFHLALGFTGYFVAGHLLHRAQLTRRARGLLYAGGIAATVVMIAVSGLVSARRGEPYTWLYDYFSPCTAVQSAAVFVLVRHAWKNRPAPDWLRRLSQYCFGIYLVHEFFVDALRRFCGLSTLTFTPALSVPVITALCFVLSAAVSALLHRIPVLKKYIV